MDRTKFEVLKVAFLENIGKVIRKHRMQKNIKIETLAADAGVSKSAISRYETGGADITASMMARISVILGFDMREYIEISERFPGDERIPIDVIFKELVRYSAQKDIYAERAPKTDYDIPPKPDVLYNREEKRWEMVEVEKVIRPSDEEAEYMDLSLEEVDKENRFFLDYMNSDESSVKRDVLRAAFVAANEASTNGKTAKTLVNAALDYAIRDEDKEVRDRLKWYRKMCEKSL